MENSDWYSPNLILTPEQEEEEDVNDTVLTEETPTLPPSILANCTLPIQPWHSDYNAATATICGLYLVFGLLCLLFGYRCFKAVMFFTGFIFASVVVYCICLEEEVLPVWSNSLIALCAGLLFGLITLLVQYVGLFMLGFHSGLLLALAGLCLAEGCWGAQPESPWISVGILLVTGLAMALVNLCFQKASTIFGSALYGGAILTTTLDYFIENSLVLMWVWDKVRVQQSVQPCWFSWIILAVWPVAMLIGIVTQVACTGKGIYHEKQFPSASQRQQATTRETREERKERKYRYLYQVRTCHGDVISQPIPGKYVHQVNETFSA